MKFVADEGVDKPIVDALRAGGHTVFYIAETNPSVADDVVLKTANEQATILITFDKDFGELVVRQRQTHHGVLLLRLQGLSKQQKIDKVLVVINRHGDELAGSFTVVTDKQIRIRSTR